MNRKLLQTSFGLKWNPFSPDVPVEALWVPPPIALFCSRLEYQAREGGFALISGDPGSGKSVALRLLAHQLDGLGDVVVGVLSRPQSHVADFYRELGHLFGVPLSPHNRWAGAKVLREKWHAHLEQTLFRPVLLVDEAQQMRPAVVAELRLLASTDFDSRSLLTVVLAGDRRLLAQLKSDELMPLASRFRARLVFDSLGSAELLECLQHCLEQAGNPGLMTPQLMRMLCEHALGNPRVLMNMAQDLLVAALQREIPQLDEKLYMELFVPSGKKQRQRAKATRT
jgi:type II secretory pathway predicted ATPase ExeA